MSVTLYVLPVRGTLLFLFPYFATNYQSTSSYMVFPGVACQLGESTQQQPHELNHEVDLTILRV